MANINVVKDYDWTSIPRGSGMRKRAPKVYVRSFKFKSSEALNRLASYFKATAQENPDEYYKKLYSDAVEAEDTFFFPYLSENIRNFSNSYGDSFSASSLGTLDTMIGESLSDISGAVSIINPLENFDQLKKNVPQAIAKAKKGDLAGAAGNLTKGMSTNPGSNVENPKLYSYEPSDGAVEVTFVLSNTVNSDWKKNHELVKKLTEINRPRRISYTFMEPPRIYKVKIPGLRFIEWAYCSSFSASMLGAKRELDGIIVPEGYLINISFTSLTIEVANFLSRV
jgi:hypothetical protein